MTRLERLSAILILLQSKRVVSGAEIARRYDVSLRTIYRDIRSLEEAGVPIGAEAGRGYFLAEGYSLPPVSFTEAEVSALVTAWKLIGPISDESVRLQFDSAIGKVLAILGSPMRDAMDALCGRIVTAASTAALQRPPYLSDIQSAICANRVLSIRYTGAAGEPTAREIEPLILCFYDMRWLLFAYCRLRRAYRCFRTDRITALSIHGELFDPAFHTEEMEKAKGALAALQPAG